jgi:hypothetical protein
MPLSLQDTKRHQAARTMMLLRPIRARLTAGQGQLILAGADDFLDLGADAIPSAHLCRRQRQPMGGVVLLAVSDHEPCDAPTQPAARSPVRVPPMVTDRLTIDPASLFEAADAIPPVVPTTLEEGFRRRPGLKEDRLGVAAQLITGRAQSLQRQHIL